MSVRQRTRSAFVGTTILMLGVSVSGTALAQTGEAGWRWSFTPYLWASDIQSDIRLRSGQEVGSEVDFDDLLDKLEFAMQGHLEGHRGQWGMFADVTFLSLGDSNMHGQISSDTDLDTGIYELAGVYTPGAENGAFAVFAGARIIDIQLDLMFSGQPGGPADRSLDKSFTDFMLGGRYVHTLSERWAFRLRGDIGEGDSESSWNALAGFDWRFGSRLDNLVTLGWRQMEIEVEQDGRETELTLSGPIAGVSFTF